MLHIFRQRLSVNSSRFVLFGTRRSMASSTASGKPHPETGLGYEKAADSSPDPVTSHSGSRTYVVSDADPQSKHYDVPSGAFSSTSPYEKQQPTSEPNSPPHSSASASPAHPDLSQKAPKNPDGVGSSSGVRYRSAPGEMAKEGGSDGGLDMMEKERTSNLEQKGMGDRNPQPLGEEEGKKGLDEAWKHRK